MKFISYATTEYLQAQRELNLEARQCKFSDVKDYGVTDLDEFFLKENQQILSHPSGAGSALWKPYLILRNLNVPVIYMDCGDRIKDFSFRTYVEDKVDRDGYLIVQGDHLHANYTRRDCFTLMGCDTKEFWELKTLEAGVCAFAPEYAKFVKVWLDWCKVTEVVMNTKNKDLFGRKNFPGFVDHKYDQSVLTNLVQMSRMKTTPISEVVKYVDYNYRG